jgi:hypothetical protein
MHPGANHTVTTPLELICFLPAHHRSQNQTWQRLDPSSVFYGKRTPSSSSSSSAASSTGVLSFTFTFPQAGCPYEFAYTIPYSYTQGQQLLASLEQRQLPFLRRGLLCRTPQGRRVDVVVIKEQPQQQQVLGGSASSRFAGRIPSTPPGGTAGAGTGSSSSSSGSGSTKRPVVIVMARVHPGEVPASHAMHGLLKFLCSDAPEAQALRQGITWVLVPMLNPDGVAVGNYRTDAAGADLNRMWLTCNPMSEPGVYAVRGLMQHYYGDDGEGTEEGEQLQYVIDIHAHSTSRTSFLFCNTPSAATPAAAASGVGGAAADSSNGPTPAAAEEVVPASGSKGGVSFWVGAGGPGPSAKVAVFELPRWVAVCYASS